MCTRYSPWIFGFFFFFWVLEAASDIVCQLCASLERKMLGNVSVTIVACHN